MCNVQPLAGWIQGCEHFLVTDGEFFNETSGEFYQRIEEHRKICHSSSIAEQRFHKSKALGANPRSGTRGRRIVKMIRKARPTLDSAGSVQPFCAPT